MEHPALKELLAYLDGELSPRAQADVETHVKACAGCQRQLNDLSIAGSEIAARGASTQEEETGEKARIAFESRLQQMAAMSAVRRRPVFAWSRSLVHAAALIALTVMSGMLLELRLKAHDQARALPNPAFTPGATRQVSLNEICAANDDEVVREVPAATQQRVFGEYGLSRARPGDFEVDYLITPGLGGADDVANLWPQPHRSEWNSYVKDQLEDRLHHMVCRGQISLPDAQRAIASNWIDAYKRYFNTDQPLHADAPADKPAVEIDQPLQRVALLR